MKGDSKKPESDPLPNFGFVSVSDDDDDDQEYFPSIWIAPEDFPTACLPLGIENWTDTEIVQLAYDRIGIYNSSNNTNFQFMGIEKQVRQHHVDQADHFIWFDAKDYKIGRTIRVTYIWDGIKPSRDDGPHESNPEESEFVSNDKISDEKYFTSFAASVPPSSCNK